MIHEKIYLKQHFKNITTDAYFATYCPDNFEEYSIGRKRKAIIIIPGGGYEMVSEREGEAIALQYLKEDIATFVINYTVKEFSYPTPIDEVFAAMIYIRDHSEEYHIDENRIALLGFSAGGHLAASCAMLWNDSYFANLFNTTNEKQKVNALILSYPVITMDKEFTHIGTMERRTHNDKDLIEKFSIEKHITQDFPKTFIWLTSTDDAVPPYNSLTLAQNLINNQITVELHMYPRGQHGLALANNNTTTKYKMQTNFPEVQTWIPHSISFVEKYL